MRAYLGCDIGNCREENQDSIRAEGFQDGVLALVCDGMGGMHNGSAASKIAVSAAEELFRKQYFVGMEFAQICELLRNCAVAANQKVYQAAAYANVPGRMGTTLVGAFVRNGHCCLVNVGDSRAYQIDSDGSIQLLTKDHTVVQLLYEKGEITAEMRATHPRRNELMRAIGATGRVLADTRHFPLKKGDSVLLCSDGLYNMVSEARIAELVCNSPPDALPDRCIAEANANGGKDNISVVLLVQD